MVKIYTSLNQITNVPISPDFASSFNGHSYFVLMHNTTPPHNKIYGIYSKMKPNGDVALKRIYGTPEKITSTTILSTFYNIKDTPEEKQEGQHLMRQYIERVVKSKLCKGFNIVDLKQVDYTKEQFGKMLTTADLHYFLFDCFAKVQLIHSLNKFVDERSEFDVEVCNSIL